MEQQSTEIMRDRILECHTAWFLGYGGYLLVLFLLSATGSLSNFLSLFQNFALQSPRIELLLFGLSPIMGLLSCLYVCLKAKERYPETKTHCREAINFQVSYTGYQTLIIFTLLNCLNNSGGVNANSFGDAFGRLALFLIFSPTVLLIELGRFVLTVKAIKKVSKGEFYHYPFNLRLW
jgi:uncharacterized Tic20 family protein